MSLICFLNFQTAELGDCHTEMLYLLRQNACWGKSWVGVHFQHVRNPIHNDEFTSWNCVHFQRIVCVFCDLFHFLICFRIKSGWGNLLSLSFIFGSSVKEVTERNDFSNAQDNSLSFISVDSNRNLGSFEETFDDNFIIFFESFFQCLLEVFLLIDFWNTKWRTTSIRFNKKWESYLWNNLLGVYGVSSQICMSFGRRDRKLWQVFQSFLLTEGQST